MTLQERRARLIARISDIKDEQTIEMLETDLQYYSHNGSSDITDELTPAQLKELIALADEPSEKDTITEDEFRKSTAKWRSR